jgi:hypothetical protein
VLFVAAVPPPHATRHHATAMAVDINLNLMASSLAHLIASLSLPLAQPPVNHIHRKLHPLPNFGTQL